MTDFINPISQIAGYAMKSANVKLREAGERLATGDRSKANIVDYVVGSQLRDTASVLKSVSKSAAYGMNLLKTTQSVLLAAKQQLVGLQDIIAQANTANPTTLAALNALYQANTSDLNRQFVGATFDGRTLLDGAVATSVTSAPLGVRVGILMSDSINVSTPNLRTVTSGLGVVAANAGATININGPRANVAIAVGNTITNGAVVATATAANAATLANVAVGDTLINSNGTQAAVIAAGNVALGAHGTVATDHIYNAAGADVGVVGGWPQALVAGETIRSADGLVTKVLAFGGATTRVQAGQKFIPVANPNAVQLGAGNFNLVAGDVAVVDDAEAIAGSLGAGDLLNPANQIAAQDLIATRVGNIVTNGLSSVGGQIESLKNAAAALANSVQVQDDAANGYLNTNYEDDSNNFKESVARIKGAIATVVLADRLVQETGRLLD